MAINISPNMNLPVPAVGTESGPDYALDINNCMAVLDNHSHAPGSGVPVTVDGLSINADLTFQSHNATSLRSIRFTPQGSSLVSATDLGCVYVIGADLYFNDTAGNVVRITQSGGVAGSPGSISNLTSPASASYSSSTQTFTWQSNALTPANLDAASIVLRNLAASSKGLTLSPPPSMAADLNQTLPVTPSVSSFMTMANTGAMSTSIPVTNGIALSNLAIRSVATAAPSGGVLRTNASANPGTTSTSYVTTGATGTLVTNGRQVVIMVVGNDTGTIPTLSAVNSSGSTSTGHFAIYRDGVLINQVQIGASASGAPNTGAFASPSSLNCIDFGASAGTHTYEVFMKAPSSAITVGVSNIRLIAYEI